MQPGNAAAVAVMAESAARDAAAREGLERMNAHRPDGHYPGDLSRTVAGASAADDGW